MDWRVLVAAFVVLAACEAASPPSPPPTKTADSWKPYIDCDNGPPMTAECLALATRYAAELPTAASCDPGDICAGQRPNVVYLGGPNDGVLEGFCNCPVTVNMARTAKLDSIFSAFLTAGCPISCCPCIPQPFSPVMCDTTAPYAGTCF
jgi:hypothetical protein